MSNWANAPNYHTRIIVVLQQLGDVAQAFESFCDHFWESHNTARHLLTPGNCKQKVTLIFFSLIIKRKEEVLYYLLGHFHVIFKVKTPVIWNSPIHGKSRSNQPIQAGKDTNKTKPSKKKNSKSPLNEARGTFSTPAILNSCHKKQSKSIWDHKTMNKMIMKAMLRLSKHREDGRIPTKLYILLDTKKNT